MDSNSYEEGKNCALRGGNYLDNPFIGKYDPKNQGLIWLRGFKDYKNPDSNCTRCNGKGKISTYVEYCREIIDFDCMCNVLVKK